MGKFEKLFIGFFIAGGILLWSGYLLHIIPIYEDFNISGSSMIEYGFHDGDKIKINKNKICEIGDACVFVWKQCYPSCEAKNHTEPGEFFIKNLFSIDNDCYFFMGNTDKKTSYDSRTFGCLKPEQFNIIGVVVK